MKPDQRRRLWTAATNLELWTRLIALGFPRERATALVQSGEAERVIREATDPKCAS